MTNHKSDYHHSVVRDQVASGHVDVALVRFSVPHGWLAHLLQKQGGDEVVLAHRTFRAMWELAEMEAYAAQLERAATHANEGTFGCFVSTEQRDDGIVRVALYERWFDGHRLRLDELASRDFDASEPDVVAASAEFLTELQAWATERNEQREVDYIEASATERDQAERAADRAEAARELAQILKSHNAPTDAD